MHDRLRMNQDLDLLARLVEEVGIMVAESTEIFAPIDQLGCATACSGVTPAMSLRCQLRKGPPDAVRMIFSTPSGRSRSRT